MMCLDDPAGDCKSKTGPVRFVSDKWLEDSLLVFGSDAASVVPDPDMQRICLRVTENVMTGFWESGAFCSVHRRHYEEDSELPDGALRDLQIFPGDPWEYGKQIRYLYQQ